MNMFPEITRLLGVKLGEIFEIDGIPHSKYRFTNMGLEVKPEDYSVWVKSQYLSEILSGQFCIRHINWKPKYGGIYYYVGYAQPLYGEPVLMVIPHVWQDSFFDINNYNSQNCFPNQLSAYVQIKRN